MSLLLDAITVGVACAHVLLAPFTKVEESFNLHATHDILFYGVGPTHLHDYDHFTFPGAVPRSFVGSVLLAWLTSPVLSLGPKFITSKADIQVCVRLVLACVNALGLSILRRAVTKRFGFATGVFFVAISYSQFHLPFWMGRTLPNMYALFPVNVAFSCILDREPNALYPRRRSVYLAFALLTFTAVVLRMEIALLLGPLVLQALLLRWVSFSSTLKVGIIAGLVSAGITTLVDTYFWDTWQSPIWPELYSIYFNVYQGKSSEWGVSPFHAYFSSHLPKLLLSALPLSVVGLVVDSRVRSFLLPPVLFVCIISALAHKEWRFIVYIVPLFNVAAARGARWLTTQRKRSMFGRLCAIVLASCLAASLLITYIMVDVSKANYPGGVALTRFNARYSDVRRVHVHIDNLAAQTGASLFLQEHAPPHQPFYQPPLHWTWRGQPPARWVYNKTEHLSAQELTSASHFTHVITEFPEDFDARHWAKVESVSSFNGFRRKVISPPRGDQLLLNALSPIEPVYTDRLWILERK